MLDSNTHGKIQQEESRPSSEVILYLEDGKLKIEIDSDHERVDSLVSIVSGLKELDFFKDVLTSVYHFFEQEDPDSFLIFSDSFLKNLAIDRPIISPIKLGLKYEEKVQ